MSYFIIFIIPASTESHQNKIYLISSLVISMDSSYLGARLRSPDWPDTQGSLRFSITWLSRWENYESLLPQWQISPCLQSMKKGDPFPIWGTCNGFELPTVLSSQDKSRLTRCESENLANSLHFIPGWERSKIYGSVGLNLSFGSFYVYLQLQAPEDILRELTKEKVTINFHENCLTPANFSRYVLYNCSVLNKTADWLSTIKG